MHINLESDYAIRIVHYLTELPADSLAGAADISTQTHVPLRFTSKIMGKLAGAGLVISQKGARGGYGLARRPAEITLRAVIEAVEGPYRFSRCLDTDYDCSCVSDTCPFYRVFDDITQAVIAKLDAATFDLM